MGTPRVPALLLRLLCLAASAAVSSRGAHAAVRTEEAARTGAVPPHIVLCLVDDLGWNSMYNNPDIISPTVDALAEAGIKLTAFYTYRFCSPTRASFLTGRLPYKLLNIRENLHSMASPDATDMRFTMLPKRLKEAHTPYYSIQIGKWHQGAASFSHTPVGRGFDESYGFLSGGLDHYSQIEGELLVHDRRPGRGHTHRIRHRHHHRHRHRSHHGEHRG